MTRDNRSGDDARSARRFDGVRMRNTSWQNAACISGRDLQFWNQKHELEPWRDFEALRRASSADIESAKFCRRSVVGMTFQMCSQFEKLLARKPRTGEGIEPMQNPDAHRRAATKSPTHWNIATDRNREWKLLHFYPTKKQIRRRPNQRIARSRVMTTNRYKIVKTQRDTETVKTRAEIRCAGGNANGDVLHDSLGVCGCGAL